MIRNFRFKFQIFNRNLFNKGLKVEMPGAAPPLQMLSDDPDPPSAVKTESATDSDPLATLASAAISTAVSNGVTPTPVVQKPTVVKQPLKNKNQWFDVGVFKSNQCTVQNFFITPEGLEKRDPDQDFDSSSLPNYTNLIKVELEPGTAYKLRVASVNACGRGPWSEISAFKTCLPGYPGAPSAIKITKV
jgi:host cell factor